MYENKVVEVEQLIEGQNRWRDTCINLDKIVKSHFSTWIPAPCLSGDKLRGYDVYNSYLILITLLSFSRRRESRKWGNPTFYETIKFDLREKKVLKGN